MSFRSCIEGKVKSNLITKAQAQQILAEYDSLFKTYRANLGDEQAAHAAAQKVVEVKIKVLKKKKLNTINAAITQANTILDIEKRMAKNKTKFDVEVLNLYERAYIRGQQAFRRHAEDIGEFIEKSREKWAGLVQDRSHMVDVIRAIQGESTGNKEANLFGGQIAGVFRKMHARFEAAGGVIGRIDNYYPQSHNPQKVKGEGLTDEEAVTEWINYMLPLLDRDRMTNQKTGLPFTDEDLIKEMREDWLDITTNGRHTIQKRADEGKQTHGFGGDVSQRRSSSRFYHFKDADAFLKYNRKYGEGDEGLFDTIIHHMQTMARDIGVLEVMGPMPNGLQRNLDLHMQGERHKTGLVKKGWVNGSYDVLVGKTMGNGEEPAWYTGLMNVQNIMRSAYLGSAPLSAISDSAFIAYGSRMNGLSATKSVAKFFKTLNPLNRADRRLIARTGYNSEIAGGNALSVARFADEPTGKGLTRWLASFTNKASGLEAMTQAAKNAVTFEFQGTVSDFVTDKKTWAKLPVQFRKAAEGHGIGEREWQVIRKAKLFEHPERKDVTYLRATEIALAEGVDKKEAMRVSNLYDDWIQSLRNTVVNEPTLRTRAIQTGAFIGDAHPGTLNRAMMSSLTMFKGFPLTVLFNHILPAHKNNKLGLAALLTGTTLLGSVAIQSRDMAKGRDPRDMTDWRFWMAAAMQGGGLGLFGDFMFADYSRFGREPIYDLAGPIVGLASDVSRVGFGNFQRALDDDSYEFTERFTRDSFSLLKRNIPAGNLWYSRLMLERLMLDSVEQLIDPQFDRNVAKREKRMMRDYGQRSWWAPGELTPERPPNLATAIGE